MMRPLLVWLHRYVGLAVTAFLVIAGLTGSAIAYYYPLDAALNPQLYQAAPPAPQAAPLDPLELRARVEAQLPEAWVHFAPLNIEPDRTVVYYVEGAVDPVTGDHRPIPATEIFVNPYDGTIQGARLPGDLSQGIALNLMPFLYKLHHTLVIPGQAGSLIMGVAALLWLVDCFVGLALTLPRREVATGSARNKAWIARWSKAWTVRWQRRLYPFSFNLHRALSLWLWAVLLVFALSSVALNLPQVYRPALESLFETRDHYAGDPPVANESATPPIAWVRAREIGASLAREQADIRGFTIVEPRTLIYDPHTETFRYVFRSERDIMQLYPSTTVFFDGRTGAFKRLSLPTGQYSGNTITQWLQALHYGDVFGGFYRAFVALLGCLIAIIAATGVVIWWKKRRARKARTATAVSSSLTGNLAPAE
ncbi:PepSY-associated TM helix domain-containing protein [Erythrobacter sp. W302b]|uniref:PepSY-associated TM helix domain-containing protein n=1 Tax=Erythrobacter sp. W302b TaxID=3389874 RepID=UPI00396B351B